jgi:tetratricopeptide (TPR) repeat protein
MAQDRSRALHFLERAGDQALAAGAYQEAVAFFTRALELDEAGPEGAGVAAEVRGGWEGKLGEANLRLGRMAACRDHLQKAVRLLGFPMPRRRWRLVFGLMRQLWGQLCHRLRPSWFVGRARNQRARVLQAAGAYDRLMRMAYFTHDTLGMFYAALRNINLAERAGPSPELVTAYASMYGIAGLIPWRSLAERYARSAYHHGDHEPDRAARLWLLAMDAIYRLGLADWNRAIGLSKEGEELARVSGASRDLEDFQGIQSVALFYQGKFDAAAAMAQIRTEAGSRRGDPQSQGFGWLVIAESRLASGELDDAHAALEQAQQMLVRDPGRTLEIFAQALLAHAALLDGDMAAAHAAADSAAALIRLGPPLSWYLVHAYGCVAQVHLELWRRAKSAAPGERRNRARAAWRSCRAVAKCASILPACRPRAWRLLGVYYQQASKTGHALRAWRESIQHAQQLQMPWDEALARLELGRALPARDHEKRTHLTDAVALLDQTAGAGPDLDAARQALAELSS